MYFGYFVIISHWKKGVVLQLEKLKFRLPLAIDALCQLRLKLHPGVDGNNYLYTVIRVQGIFDVSFAN